MKIQQNSTEKRYVIERENVPASIKNSQPMTRDEIIKEILEYYQDNESWITISVKDLQTDIVCTYLEEWDLSIQVEVEYNFFSQN